MSGEQASGWVKAAIAFMALVIPLFSGGMAAYVGVIRGDFSARDAELSRRITTAEGILSGLASSVARGLQHAEDHESDAAREIARIDRCEQRLDSIAKEFVSGGGDRASAHGRDNREMIAGIERRVDALEQMPVRVDWLGGRVDKCESGMAENERLFHRIMVPLIEESNRLQMMQLQQQGIRIQVDGE